MLSRAEQSPGNNLLLSAAAAWRPAPLKTGCCFQDGQVTAQLLLLTVAQQSRAEPRTHLLLDVDYYLLPAPRLLSHLCRPGPPLSQAELCSNCRTRLMLASTFDTFQTHLSKSLDKKCDFSLAAWLSHLCLVRRTWSPDSPHFRSGTDQN